MEIKIGVLNVPTQIVIDSDETVADIKAKVADALAQGSILELTDSKGTTTLVPAAQIGFVEIGAESKRRIGFGIGVGE
ncbi:DUF3107 domain-containing protein [Rothia sp. (in: high G+C Gram-positive bacteria)]|uniref:DUF3107 domain-containing protein n=1 Tax=Rothia sp. (in: high G+C Gram-positive bacteria) TaxID=1885016 RepID=UPI000EE62800|nr:DUF3107 domain-containing protein [Rothia sp. (in: high G+C Gram-positive bacteria)]